MNTKVKINYHKISFCQILNNSIEMIVDGVSLFWTKDNENYEEAKKIAEKYFGDELALQTTFSRETTQIFKTFI